MIGTKVAGRYEVLSELGRGGMGQVFRARDPVLEREVALKLLPAWVSASAEAETRFRREAQLIAQLEHPGIITIHDFGRHEGALFYVMPVVRGKSLRALLSEAALRLGECLEIVAQVADALEFSHAHGVVHRDVKPENIMVLREGGSPRVRVMDFGLARAAADHRLTRSGMLVGTMAYLSPEQVAREQVDGRSDVYALGAVLFECLVGEPPFTGSLESVLYRVVHEEVRAPRLLGAPSDETLDRIVLWALAKQPWKRPQAAGELAGALRDTRRRLAEGGAERVLERTGSHAARSPRSVEAARFVGRDRELLELRQRLGAASAGACQLVLVGGDAGVGKSRLLEELERLARARRMRVLRGRFMEQDRAFSHQGFCDIIRDHFRSRGSAPESTTELADLAPELVRHFPVLGEIPELRSASSGARPEPEPPRPAEGGARVFELVARTLVRIAGDQPLVLILEDLHGADASIEALRYVVQRLAHTPTLIAGTYRRSEVDKRHPLRRLLDSLADDPHLASITLGPLSREDHAAFVQSLLGATALEGSGAHRLYEATDGNALFTRELVQSLVESQRILPTETGVWDLHEGSLGSIELPATIQQAVEKRVERLPADRRELLATAAVLGRSFELADLEALAPAGVDIEAALDAFERDGLLEEERGARGDRLAFPSGVLRDVLYAAYPRRRRRTLHRRIAERLETRHASRLERVYPQLLYHYAQGDVAQKAVEYGLARAVRSLAAFIPQDAISALRTALEFLTDEGWEGEALEGEARLQLAAALRMAGTLELALREAEAAVRALERERRPGQALAAMLLCAQTAWQGRRFDQTRAWIERGLEQAGSLSDADRLGQLLSLAGTVATLRGEYEQASALAAEAEQLARSTAGSGHPAEVVAGGGRIRVALVHPVRATHPARIAIVEEVDVLSAVFETLVRTNIQGHLVPWLCERWEPQAGASRFVLRLRPQVRLSDGSALTAPLVAQSLERSLALAPLPPALAALAPGGIAALDDVRLLLRLQQPLPLFPALLTDPRTAIAVAVDAQNEAVVLGTGPFRIASHEPARVVLERNPAYWKEPLAHLDELEFVTVAGAGSIVASLRAGEIDLARDVPPAELEDVLRDPQRRTDFAEAARSNTYFMLFNQHSAALREPALRHVLGGLLRVPDLVWRSLGRFGIPAQCLIPPGILGHDAGRRREIQGREQALLSLRLAGIELPRQLRVAVHPVLRDRYRALTDAIFEAWAEAGVAVELHTPGIEAFLASSRDSAGLDVWLGRWGADYPDPDNFSHGLFHSRHGRFRSWFCSAETDQLAEEARASTDSAAREALYRRFEGVLAATSVVLPLFHEVDYCLTQPRIQGRQLNSAPPYVDYAALWIAPAAAAASKRAGGGGTIRVPTPMAVPCLDPRRIHIREHAEVLTAVFESLTRVSKGGRAVPWLASEVQSEEAGRRFRIRLRPGVRFHDGRRLTSRDVRYSFERLLAGGDSEGQRLLAPIRGARALVAGEVGDLAGLRILSSSELVIELERPVSFFPELLSTAPAAILPEGSAPVGPAWAETTIGTGPFRVLAFAPGERLELARNQTYWREGYPRADALVFTFGVASERIATDFRAGHFSLAADLRPPDLELLRQQPEYAAGYREAPRLSTHWLAFNANHGPLRDESIRRRLIGAIDVDGLVRRTLGRVALPAQSLIPPGLLGHDRHSAAKRSSTSMPAQAATAALAVNLPTAALTAAGAAPAAETTLTAAISPTVGDDGPYAPLLRELLAGWRAAGFSVRIVSASAGQLFEALREGLVDIVIARWAADYPDADSFVHGMLHTTEGFVGRFCGTETIDRLAERGRAESDPPARHAVYRQVESLLAQHALLLPLFHEQLYRLARPEVEGLGQIDFLEPVVAYENLRIRV